VVADPPGLEQLLGPGAIAPQEAFQIFTLEPAIAPRAQAIGANQLFVGPLSYCVGMNMQDMSHLSSGHHS